MAFEPVLLQNLGHPEALTVQGYRDRGDQWSVPTWHSPLSCRGSLGGVASER